MCLIALHLIQGIEGRLLVGANRDEFFARPSQGVHLLSSQPYVLGGRDLLGGGTWLGLNEYGLLVALTNYRPPASSLELEGLKRGGHSRGSSFPFSRGQLVMQALRCASVHELTALLRKLEPELGGYGPFNLLFGNHLGLQVAQVPQGKLTLSKVDDGFHVLPSGAGLDDHRSPKVRRCLALLEQESRFQLSEPSVGDTDELDAMAKVLTDHVEAPLETWELKDDALPLELERRLAALCVHTDSYGTRSSSILRIGTNLCDYLACDSAPCSGTYVRVDHELPAKRWISS